MSKPDYTAKRGDSIDIGLYWPAADLTGITLWATLKLKLDDVTNDDAAAWLENFDCDDPDVCDDPTTGYAYITIPGGSPEVPQSGTYNLRPNKIYYIDVQANFPDGPKTIQGRILIKRDGTRRTS
jgi:hypothetical protein